MKNNKGITLVALVVTIIVLLILAAVSINLVLGDNGIITRAKQAKERTEQSAEDELEVLTNLEDDMEDELADDNAPIELQLTLDEVYNSEYVALKKYKEDPVTYTSEYAITIKGTYEKDGQKYIIECNNFRVAGDNNRANMIIKVQATKVAQYPDWYDMAVATKQIGFAVYAGSGLPYSAVKIVDESYDNTKLRKYSYSLDGNAHEVECVSDDEYLVISFEGF